jgi:hypothetical protein
LRADALGWLLEPRDPPVRLHALTDVLHLPSDSREAVSTRKRVLSYGPVRRILRAQTSEGYWPPQNTCYLPKYTATVWPLILLGEMGVPPEPRIKTACERFLSLHQMDNGAFSPLRVSNGEKRRGWKMEEEPCLTGNMIRTLIVFGYGEDPRVRKAIEWMPEHQQEDGGWNCDYPQRQVKHSSFMSTIEPLWAYSEIPRSRWTRRMKGSIERGAGFLLMHHIYKSDHHDWSPTELWGEQPTKFHFPMYYYYDALHGLRVLAKLGYGDDERVGDAVHLILSKKTPEGKWLLEGDWLREWKGKTKVKRRKTIVNLEPLMKPSKWVTLNCYRALLGTGDLEVPRTYTI